MDIIESKQLAVTLLKLKDESLIEELTVYDVMASSYVWEMSDMNEERIQGLSQMRKQFYYSLIAQVVVFFWNQSTLIGLQAQNDGFSSTTVLSDLPDSLKAQIDRFKLSL